MPFIGNQPAQSYSSFAKQDFTTSATTAYTLNQPVANENEIALFINFVRQEPTTAYTASGTSLTLTSATSASDDMYAIFLGKAVQTVNPPAGSVGTSQLASTAVTTSKIADANVTSAKMFSGFENGITIADQWYAQQDQSIATATVTVLTGGASGWSRTPKTLMGSIGLNMSESSGVFTFPSTGIYYINFKCEMYSDGTGNYRVAQANIQGTTDNSTYNTISTSTSNFGAERNAAFTTVNIPYIVDITDTANQKIRFTVYFSDNTGNVGADLSPADTRTMATFVRIGDT